MLYLLTGKPGNGKTLWVIDHLLKELEKEERPVYVYGVAGLNVPGWLPLDDPMKWYECPEGSVIVMDEAQKVFPTRPHDASSLQHITEFETHRHRGHDVYLITQDPLLVDAKVRKIVGTHIHFRRQTGHEWCNVYYWRNEVQSYPDRADAREIAYLSERFKFPRSRYGLYKSADIHTHKPDFPWRRIVMAGVMVVAFVFCMWFVFTLMTDDDEESEGLLPDSLSGRDSQSGASGSVESVAGGGGLWSSVAMTPRVPGMVLSAPMYDPVVQVVAAPKIDGCLRVVIGGREICRCNSQRGTRVPVTPEQCRHFMENGWFDFTISDGAWREARESLSNGRSDPSPMWERSEGQSSGF